MTVNDTVRIKKTDIIGTITKIEGRHLLVKSNDYPIPLMFYDYELEPMHTDDTLIGCIGQSEADAI